MSGDYTIKQGRAMSGDYKTKQGRAMSGEDNETGKSYER
jgi:hypothetical protein